MSSTTAAERRDREALREQQMKQAEDLLFSGPRRPGFVKALFRGAVRGAVLFPFGTLPEPLRLEAADAARSVQMFIAEHLDAAAIDRRADIPAEVIQGLGRSACWA